MVEDFLQLGAQQLRRELCDMARHYFGPLGQGANHDSHATKLLQYTAPHRGREPFNSNSGLQKLATWTEIHSFIDALPKNEKRAFDLLWYHELGQTEAAEILNISERQLRRDWQSARLMLQRRLGESGQLR